MINEINEQNDDENYSFFLKFGDFYLLQDLPETAKIQYKKAN